MVQALINSNNITSSIKNPPAAADSAVQTDFQKLFDKQNQDLEKTEKDNETKEKNSDKKVNENQTFAGSVIYDIRQMFEFLKSASQKDDENSDSEAESLEEIAETTAVEDCGETEIINSDAEKIAKKLLHIDEAEEEEDGKTKDLKEEKNSNTEDVQDVLNYDKTESFLENFEITAEETGSEIQPAVKKAEAETEQKLEDIINDEQLEELKIESLEAESGDSSGEDIMQKQTPEEQGVKAMLQGDVEFKEVKTAEVQTPQKPTQPQEANPSKIIEQITKQMEALKSGSKVSMVLNPEALGKVSIQLINTKEGLSAQFTVATQDARNLIMKGLDGLKDTLMAHGVNVDNVSVKLSETQESEYNSDWTEQEGSRGGNKQQNPQKEQKGKEQFEQMMSSLEENGNV